MPRDPTKPIQGRFTSPTYEDQREAMMRLNNTLCVRCGGTGTIKVKVGWRPSSRDKVGGALPPVIEYDIQPCPACGCD